MRRASVGGKDFSGLVGFDYYELHFFTPLGPSFWVSDSGFKFLVFFGDLEILVGGSGADATGFSRV